MNLLVAEDGRPRAIWRFVLGATVVVLGNSFAGGVALKAGSPLSYAFDAVYRPAMVLFLLAGFSILLVIFDRAANPLPAMGLGRPWKPDAVRGLLIGGSMVVVGAACIAVGGDLSLAIVLSGRAALQVMVIVFILATAAMAEELAFRGYPFQRLLESLGPWPAVVIMSLLFAAVHLLNPNASPVGFINTALIGAVLCAAYLRTRKLWLPFGIHLGWNAMLGLVLGLPVSGLRGFSVVVEGSARGPLWLTGGSYGIEASLTGTAVILLGFLALVAFVPQVEPPKPPPAEAPLEEVPPAGADENPEAAPPKSGQNE